MIKQTPFQRPGWCPSVGAMSSKAAAVSSQQINIASQSQTRCGKNLGRTAATKQIRSQTDTYNYSELLKIINLNCDEPYFCPVGCVLNLIFINPDKFALSLIFSFDYKAKECKVSSHPLSKLLCYIYI